MLGLSLSFLGNVFSERVAVYGDLKSISVNWITKQQ